MSKKNFGLVGNAKAQRVKRFQARGVAKSAMVAAIKLKGS